MNSRELKVRTVLFAVSCLAMLWGYRLLLFLHAPSIFNDQLEDLSYGWFVPLFTLFVLWTERRRLVEAVGRPSVGGVVMALPFLFAGFLGARGEQIRLEIVSFVGLLLSLAWAFFGWEMLKRVLYPVLFLLFCLPLHTYLDLVTIHLRTLAVSLAYEILNGFGVDVVRVGTSLQSTTGAFAPIDVAEPCSGMRSLFAMMTVTAGYAYFAQPTMWRRGFLLVLSVPIAVLGNVMRIFSIVAVAATCSADFATGFYHDYSGYVVFLVSIALMVMSSGLITKGAERCVRS